MKLWLVFLSLFAGLQYQLWMGQGNIPEVLHLNQLLMTQENENRQRRERNQMLAAEVMDLKEGVVAIEERARNELGMIKQDEIFYQLID